jgi:sigma-70-like protein
MKMLGDPAEAQDALQDVFIQIWSRAGSYDAEQSSVFIMRWAPACSAVIVATRQFLVCSASLDGLSFFDRFSADSLARIALPPSTAFI